ncbi:MAG: ATP-binding protein [Chloroflexi bacterium]|nr:ATP-binding protein [Chloroflexota bacterium]
MFRLMTEEQRIQLGHDWELWAREGQLPPKGDWRIWLIMAGRGWGKTIAITEWAIEQARAMPKSRGALVAPTEADARSVLVEGESGILTVSSPQFMPYFEPSLHRLTFPNGSTAQLFSAEEPNRLRGPQHHWAIADEIAIWQYAETLDMLLLGLRLGENPRLAIATTPRPIPLIKRLLKDPTVTVVRGSTYENRSNLAPAFFDEIISRYAGTRIGRQEIDGALLDDARGGLFRFSYIESARVGFAPDLERIVVAVDPAVTSNEDSDETGIIVAGLDIDGHGYVLDDLSLKGSPGEWARTAVEAYHAWSADRIVAEVNNGGDLVKYTVATIDPLVPFTAVRASRGKIARAEPVAALYEQGKIHHVDVFRSLETQMIEGMTRGAQAKSPDRVDALVWALSSLMLASADDDEILMRHGRVREDHP